MSYKKASYKSSQKTYTINRFIKNYSVPDSVKENKTVVAAGAGVAVVAAGAGAAAVAANHAAAEQGEKMRRQMSDAKEHMKSSMLEIVEPGIYCGEAWCLKKFSIMSREMHVIFLIDSCNKYYTNNFPCWQNL